MKLIGFVNNYGDCAESSALITFPDSCLINQGKPLFLPDFDPEFRLMPSLAVRICRLGKCIAPKFAYRYYDSFAVGFNVCGMQTLRLLRAKGLPWDAATCFDGSIITGEFFPIERMTDSFTVNIGDISVVYHKEKLGLSIDNVVAEASEFRTLKNGDIIFAGFACGPVVAIGDSVLAQAEDLVLCSFRVR